jgi:hypothetical protein
MKKIHQPGTKSAIIIAKLPNEETIGSCDRKTCTTALCKATASKMFLQFLWSVWIFLFLVQEAYEMDIQTQLQYRPT